MARQPKPLEQLSPAYARRIAKALAAGKTRQEGRGKAKGGEYAQRKAAAERKAAGLPPAPPRRPAPLAPSFTKQQRGAVRRFADAQLPRKFGRNFTAAQKTEWRAKVAKWADGIGWGRFQEFRTLHRIAELQTRREVHFGTYERRTGRRGEGTTILDDWMEDFELPDPDLGFYH